MRGVYDDADNIYTCDCGEKHQYSDRQLARIVEGFEAELGPTIVVTSGGRSYRVPRHYISFHGLKAWKIPGLAELYGWEQVV